MVSTTILVSASSALFACWATVGGWVLMERYLYDRVRERYRLDVEAFSAGRLDLGEFRRRRLRRLAVGTNLAAATAAARLLVRAERFRLHELAEGAWRKSSSLRALTVLVRAGSPDAVRLLRAAIARHDQVLTTSLLRLAGELQTEAADALLLEVLVEGRHPRARTATELEPRTSRLREELIGLTTHQDANLRYWALTLLAREMRDAAAAVAAALCAVDDDASVRAAAAEALGSGVDWQLAHPLLRRLLHDDVFFVRSHAARAVGTAGDGSLAGELLPLLADQNWWVRAAAKESLLILGGDGLEVALAALAHPDRFARDGALEIIVASGELPQLIAAAESGDAAAQAAVAAMRGRMAGSIIESAPLALPAPAKQWEPAQQETAAVA